MKHIKRVSVGRAQIFTELFAELRSSVDAFFEALVNVKTMDGGENGMTGAEGDDT